MLKDKGNPAGFGPPIVAPGVGVDPVAAKYLQNSPAALGLRPPVPRPMPAEHSMPVGGVPMPPIPPLDGQAEGTGLAMADYAVRRMPLSAEHQAALGLGGGAPGARPPWAAPLPPPVAPARPAWAATPPAAPSAPPPTQAGSMTRGLLPTDTLPERAKNDPAWQQGMGSEMAVNQPALAMKYGVVRNGNLLAPQQLGTGRGGLSPQTQEGLNAVQRQMEQQQQQPDPAPLEAAGRLGEAGAAREARPADTEREKKKALAALDDFDWMRMRSMMNDILSNEDQREIVEARCAPLSLDDLIMLNSVTQDVPIVVDPVTGAVKFKPTFRSTNGQENLALKLALTKEVRALDLHGAYFDDKFGMMGACASLFAINDIPFPDHLDAEGNFVEALFWEKFNRFVKMSVHTISSIGVHAFWFDLRVRKLHVAEKVRFG